MVFVIPPPVKTSSEIFDKFLITFNLEDTFDHPTIESMGEFFELMAC